MWLQNSFVILLLCCLATVIAEPDQARTEESIFELNDEEGFERLESSEEEQEYDDDDEQPTENTDGIVIDDEDEDFEDEDSEDGNKELKRGRGRSRVDAGACLRAHNAKRALHQDTPALVWDAKLARRAKKWAKRLAKKGKLEHESNTGEGENLYWSRGSAIKTCSDAVAAWYSEIKDYNYNNPGFSSGTGHFTQVVWKKTTKVGVALKKKKISKGKIETYIVARYSPPGNYRGQFQQNVERLIKA
ncbi:hypothetical protein ACROYT_G018979 [Oculina patagonica]